MKQIVLAALNAKYFHTNLAVRCLKACAGEDYDIEIVESTINDNLDIVLEEIVSNSPDAVGFSCYIWNIDYILQIAGNLKKILPECLIFFGGPEVSFDSKSMMKRHPFIDMIIKGEGEITLLDWLKAYQSNKDFSSIEATTVRKGEEIVDNPPRKEKLDFDELPFLYNNLTEYENKIIYFETSRGCPMKCAYCMSGNSGGMSYMNFEKVEKAFSYFLENNVKQVKLVDRTFNYPLSRAKKIIAMLIEKKKLYPSAQTNFHFEITASLIDNEFLEILKQAPEGLIQFEAGVQSTHPETLKAITRSVDSEKLLKNIKEIAKIKNITVYADIIAGLPYESYTDFKKSFNDVYKLKTDKIHLGFLKVLKGSAIKEKVEEYGIAYSERAPYKVLKTKDISYDELSRLEKIEHLLELYKNSSNFQYSCDWVADIYETPFDFFENFMEYAWNAGFYGRTQSILKQFEMLYDFMSESNRADETMLKDKLLFDWSLLEKPRRYPVCIEPQNESGQKEFKRNFFNDIDNIERYLPDYIGLAPQAISRMCHIAFFEGGSRAVLFNYKKQRIKRAVELPADKEK